MPIFVCGATGTQGGALITNLLASNIKVHAITRDPSTERSQTLKTAGVALFKGDFNDEESLHKAMTGCKGLFLNLSPSFTDPNQEITQANRILSIAKQVGIQNVVYSSGLVTAPTHRQYWNPTSFAGKVVLTKNQIEDVVRNAGFKSYTILRPGNFMTNYLAPFVYPMSPGLAEKGETTTAFTRDTVLPMIDPNDIGRFGAAAFAEPARFNGEEIAIASQMMTLEDILSSLSKATGRDLKASYMTQAEIEAKVGTNPFLAGQLMMRDMSDEVDIDEVRAWGVEMGSFEGFLERERGRVEGTYLQAK